MSEQTDWDDLRFVLAVGRAGGLSGAARALGVNHSTVFRRIGALEARLGVRLFERHASGYSATAAGEELLAAATEIEEQVIGVERQVAGRDVRLVGTVRCATTDTMAQGLLMPHHAAFRAAYPGIVVELAIATRFVNLTRRDADVALRPTNQPPDNLIGRRLATIAFAVYGAPAYLAAHPAADLGGQEWITVDESLGHLATAHWLERHWPDAPVALRVDTLTGILEAARAGLGLAALPCYLADPHADLRRVTLPIPEMATALWLLTHRESRRSARVRAFLDFMAHAIGHERDRLEGPVGRGVVYHPSPCGRARSGERTNAHQNTKSPGAADL